jgi:hypothetical protein
LKQLYFISKSYPGKEHDFTIFKEIFAGFDFSSWRVHVDLGFLGILKAVVTGQVNIPHKKPPKNVLTATQKAENSRLSSLRVVIENSIAKMKSYFILRIENRMRKNTNLDDVVELCAALANLKTNNYLSIKH